MQKHRKKLLSRTMYDIEGKIDGRSLYIMKNRKPTITSEQREMLKALYERNRGKMYRIAYSKLGSSEDAMDAVHEAFCRVMTDIDRISSMPPEQQGLFLDIIVRNVAVDMYRKRVNAPVPAELPEELPDSEPDTEDTVIGNISKDELIRFIKTLPDNQREILEMTCIFGISYEQAAKYLGISENTAYQRIYRARTAVRKFLKEAEDNEK